MRRNVVGWTAGAVLLLGSSAMVSAQEQTRPITPQIVTSAQGEVRVAPDRASIVIGVQTRAATAADAAAQNSRKQRAVIDAIKARGVPAEQIGTSNFNVIPETRYDSQGQAPRITSYLVTNSVTVELKRIDLVGPVIDAALANGANQITSLSFGIIAADSARRAALSAAVGKAKADAEVMARAAGGSLGTLIELVAGETYMPPPRPMMAMARMDAAQSPGVPVEPGQEVVRAGVTARWQFVSGTPR
jgi:uncharacterized protein YggE